ncbi:MAG: hypothetical protein NPIRA04_12460 [Nitrospirales bacterium]|nr:MAG: hypothetical protein NPIRA04_12460 [Nitrospirales bacterium]
MEHHFSYSTLITLAEWPFITNVRSALAFQLKPNVFSDTITTTIALAIFKLQPLDTLEEFLADMHALEKETEGLLDAVLN